MELGECSLGGLLREFFVILLLTTALAGNYVKNALWETFDAYTSGTTDGHSIPVVRSVFI